MQQRGETLRAPDKRERQRWRCPDNRGSSTGRPGNALFTVNVMEPWSWIMGKQENTRHEGDLVRETSSTLLLCCSNACYWVQRDAFGRYAVAWDGLRKRLIPDGRTHRVMRKPDQRMQAKIPLPAIMPGSFTNVRWQNITDSKFYTVDADTMARGGGSTKLKHRYGNKKQRSLHSLVLQNTSLAGVTFITNLYARKHGKSSSGIVRVSPSR